MEHPETHDQGQTILVVNQHGDNRGDEAAMRAMMSGLAERLPYARFVVLHQFSNPEMSCVPTPEDVTYLPIRMSLVEGLRLALASLLLWLGLPARVLAGPLGRQILISYDRAVAVVSAPGGPYFGDIYADHEVVHWFFVWLGHIHDLPLALYAPSVGPFENRLLNPIRRRGFQWFDLLVLREERSAHMLERLLPGLDIVVTVDSALQADPESFQFDRAPASAGDQLLVVGAFRDPGASSRERHDKAVIEALSALSGRVNMRVVLAPQVHGPHRDQPYLESLAARLSETDITAIVMDEHADSNEHRAMVAEADLVLAGRYHPAVFAVAAQTPVLVIPYEHKAYGLAEAAGLSEWVIDVRNVSEENMREMVLSLHERRDEVREILAKTSPELREQASCTSQLVARLAAGTSPNVA